MRNFFTWIKAVLHHWGSIVTSGAIIGGIGIWQGTGHHVPVSVYWVIAVVGLIIAFYKAWLDEYKKVSANKPDFLVDVTSALAHYEADNTLILMGIRIRNKGADSAVLAYKVDYESPTLYKDDAQIIHLLNEELILNLPGGKFAMRGTDAITQNRSVMKRGDFIAGRLPFVVPGNKTQEVQDGKAKIRVRVYDYLEKEYSIVFTGTGPYPGSPGYMFGEPSPPTPKHVARAMGDVGKLNPRQFNAKKKKKKKK